ncbi:hypothetical protein CBOM_00939 [Ceraceosorus bombacis]|uniref:Uncharacterized protein n=1 Tax=Ceraceosorus bombacis TaxID=401625 RepID=A0A0P1BC02_9BASI|nr:hypothetical protein CBOM_00939 [Ceraceosorus bombacis]
MTARLASQDPCDGLVKASATISERPNFEKAQFAAKPSWLPIIIITNNRGKTSGEYKSQMDSTNICGTLDQFLYRELATAKYGSESFATEHQHFSGVHKAEMDSMQKVPHADTVSALLLRV